MTYEEAMDRVIFAAGLYRDQLHDDASNAHDPEEAQSLADSYADLDVALAIVNRDQIR